MTGNTAPRPSGAPNADCRDYIDHTISAIEVHDHPFISDEVADEIVAELREIENVAHE